MRIKDSYTNTPISFRGRGLSFTTMRNLNELGGIINYNSLGNAHTLDITGGNQDNYNLGAGARTLEIVGLDDRYRFQSEIINLNGQTPVTTSKQFLRVFSAQVLETGASETNSSSIFIYKTGSGGTLTGGVPSDLSSAWIKINPSYGIGTSGMFTVPEGITMEARKLIVSSRTQPSELFLVSSNPLDESNQSLSVEFSFCLNDSGTTIDFPVNNSFRWTEKTDIYFRFLSSTAGGVVTADLQLRILPSFS